MKFLSLLILAVVFSTLQSQQTAKTQHGTFNNFIAGVALSCAESVIKTKVLQSDTASLSAQLITGSWIEQVQMKENQDSEHMVADQGKKALEQYEKELEDLYAQKKNAWIAALKKEGRMLLGLIAAYIIATIVQDKIPQASLYQASSKAEAALIFVTPFAISRLASLCMQRYFPPTLQNSKLIPWIMLITVTIFNYLTTVQIYSYFQPYTMPTMNQHLFNFTGNYLAPNVCCQLVV